jgi:hypothetical protein
VGQRYEGVSLLAAAAQRCPFTEEFSETKKSVDWYRSVHKYAGRNFVGSRSPPHQELIMIATHRPPFLIALAGALVLFLTPTLAHSERLTPLGDFATTHPTLIPQSSCSAGGRTFVLAEGRFETRNQALLEGFQFPEGSKVIKRFMGRDYGNIERFELGCFSIGGRAAIPAGTGVYFIDNKDTVSFVPYPPKFSYPRRAILGTENIVVVGSQAEAIKIPSYGSARWVLEPVAVELDESGQVGASTLAYEDGMNWVELDLTNFSRRKRSFGVAQVSQYFTLTRGLLMITESDQGDFGVVVGDGSQARSSVVGGITEISPWSMTHALVGGRIVFTANEREVWTSDGSIAGTRKIFSTPTSENRISVLGYVGGGVLIKNETLRRVDIAGAITVLATGLSSSQPRTIRDAQGRLLFVDQGKLVRTNGTVAGTSVIVDERLHGDAVISWRDRIVVADDWETYKVDRGVVEPVSFVDTQVTEGSKHSPIGSIRGRALFSDYSADAGSLYLTDGTTAGTSRVLSGVEGFMQGLGGVGDTFLFADTDANLYSLSASSAAIQSRKISSALEADSFWIEKSFEVSGGTVFVTEDAVWRTDGSEGGTVRLASLPEDTARVHSFNQIGDKVFFSVKRRGEMSPVEPEMWVTNGTTAGTHVATEGPPVGSPYIAEVRGESGVYVRLPDNSIKQVWRSWGAGSDGCGEPQLLRLEGAYFVYGRCDGLSKISADLTGGSAVVKDSFMPWVVSHRGHIYFPRKTANWGDAIARVHPVTGVVEDVHVLDDTLHVGSWEDFHEALSMGDKLMLWLRSEFSGNEPYILAGDEDECPADPYKIVKGICGCGVADSDQNDNSIADCEEGKDQCPRDLNKREPGYCGCGIADVDVNSNGSPDCIERRGDWCGYPRFTTWCGISPTPTPGYY